MFAAIAYLFILFGTNDILNQSTHIRGRDITYKLMNYLTIEVFAAITAFYLSASSILL